MKKVLSIIFAMAVGAGMAFADSVQIGDLYYNLDDVNNTAEVTSSHSNSEWNIVSAIIPDTVEYNNTQYAVVGIGRYALAYCPSLTSVYVPSGVKRIEEKAFLYSEQLAHVDLNEGLEYIGDEAFHCCLALDSLYIPHSLVSTGYIVCGTYLGYDRTRLKTLAWNANPDLIDQFWTDEVTTLHIGNDVDSIPASFIGWLTTIQKLSIGRNVTYIEDRALQNCTALTSVYWNATRYTAYAASVFATISSNITSFVFGEDVETIPEYLCYSMKNIPSVTIPQSVTFIGNCAFYECNNLKEIHVPDLAAYCNIDFGGDPNWYLYADLYVNGEKITTDLVIPEGTTTLHSYAFKFKSITTVTLPSSLQVAENDPFYDILNIHVPSVDFWLNLEKQGQVASYRSGGSNLYVNDELVREIIIPETKTSISDYEFTRILSIQFVSIHRNVQSIGTHAFYYCKGLDSLYNYASTPQTISTHTFEGITKYTSGHYKCKFHIPHGTIESYRAAGWVFHIDPNNEEYRDVYDDLFGTYFLDQAILAATAYHDSLGADYADIADTLRMAIEEAQTIADTATIQAVVDTASQTLNEAVDATHERVAARLASLKTNFEAYKQEYVDILDSVKNVFAGGELRWLFDYEGNSDAYITKIQVITYDSLMLYPDNIAVVDSVMNWIQNELEQLAAQIIEHFQHYKPDAISSCEQLHQEGDSEACDSLIAAAVATIENYEYDITKTENENLDAMLAICQQLDIDLQLQREKDRQEAVETINGEGILLRKTLRNGQVVIERGDKVFTVTGKEL